MRYLRTPLLILCYLMLCPSLIRGQEHVVSDSITVQDATPMIRDFYKAYITNLVSGISQNESRSSNELLKEKFLTKGLIEKIGRIRMITVADPIIRAQNLRKDALETLKVSCMNKDWYMVSYDWSVNKKVKHTEIPLRVMKKDGSYMIDYITPEWHGSLYGDSLLYEDPERLEVDPSTPLSLLKTFYKAYTATYCSMPEDLNRKLSVLRAEYLTPNALAQFEEAATNKYKKEGRMNYDLLIDCFDFDCLWLSSMTFTRLEQDVVYRMRYTSGKIPRMITLRMTGKDGKYRIDSVSDEQTALERGLSRIGVKINMPPYFNVSQNQKNIYVTEITEKDPIPTIAQAYQIEPAYGNTAFKVFFATVHAIMRHESGEYVIFVYALPGKGDIFHDDIKTHESKIYTLNEMLPWGKIKFDFNYGAKFKSVSFQDVYNLDLLLTHCPREQARELFNADAMVMYPMNLQGNVYEEKYTVCRAVVAAKDGLSFFLYFMLTDDNYQKFDTYLQDIAKVFLFN